MNFIKIEIYHHARTTSATSPPGEERKIDSVTVISSQIFHTFRTHSHSFSHISTYAHVGESTHTCTITYTALGSVLGTGRSHSGPGRSTSGDTLTTFAPDSISAHGCSPLSGGRAQADHQAGAKPRKPGHLCENGPGHCSCYVLAPALEVWGLAC